MTREKTLEEALYRVLDTGRIDVAKEIAADALEVEVDEFVEETDMVDLEFSTNDDEYPEDSNLFIEDDEYPVHR